MYRKYKSWLIVLICASIILIFSFQYVLATDALYVWSNQSDSAIATSSNVTSNQTVETDAVAADNSLDLTCGGAVLMEQNSGKVLYEHNSHEQLRPASVTKVMSLLLIMEEVDSGRLKLTDKVACSENAASMGGSQIWLDVREELTVDEMLKAICVVSANDCVVAMAEHIAGSESAFVDKMNEKARALGMNDTTFKNCHGIDEDGHVTSAYDIALMSRELMKNHPTIKNYTTIWMDSLRDGKSELVNTNKLIRTYKGITGLKTGSTSVALYNLSATATRDDLSLIAVIMKAETSAVRFSEAQKLLDYGFSNYSYKQFAKAGDVIKTIQVEKGIENTVNAIFENDSGSLMKKGQETNVVQEIKLDEIVKAPVEKGQKIGEVIYTLNGEVIGNTNIVADKEIKKMTILNSALNIYKKWFCLTR